MRKQYRYLISCILGMMTMLSSIHGEEKAVLSATIVPYFEEHLIEKNQDIAPGSKIGFRVKVKNNSDVLSEEGNILVRFAFPKPLDKQVNSILFETEKVLLPSLNPGQIEEVIFKKEHMWPSFFDFMRENWPMRNYEAVVEIEKENNIIGSFFIGYTVNYHAGFSFPNPKEVIAKSINPSEKIIAKLEID